MILLPPSSTLFPYTTLFRSIYSGSGRSIPGLNLVEVLEKQADKLLSFGGHYFAAGLRIHADNLESFAETFEADRSEEHTSELQSRPHLVCRLLLEKKKTNTK